MSGRFIIGVDPGFTGGITVLNTTGLGPAVTIFDMPTMPGAKGKTELNHAKLHHYMSMHKLGGPKTTVWVERVSARPGQGVSSVFRFGQQLGAIEMCAAAHEHEIRYVTPAVWKAYFGLSADKGVARGEASRRFPAHAELFARVKDDGRAESALIALYGLEHSK